MNRCLLLLVPCLICANSLNSEIAENWKTIVTAHEHSAILLNNIKDDFNNLSSEDKKIHEQSWTQDDHDQAWNAYKIAKIALTMHDSNGKDLNCEEQAWYDTWQSAKALQKSNITVTQIPFVGVGVKPYAPKDAQILLPKIYSWLKAFLNKYYPNSLDRKKLIWMHNALMRKDYTYLLNDFPHVPGHKIIASDPQNHLKGLKGFVREQTTYPGNYEVFIPEDVINNKFIQTSTSAQYTLWKFPAQFLCYHINLQLSDNAQSVFSGLIYILVLLAVNWLVRYNTLFVTLLIRYNKALTKDSILKVLQ